MIYPIDFLDQIKRLLPGVTTEQICFFRNTRAIPFSIIFDWAERGQIILAESGIELNRTCRELEDVPSVP